LVAYGHGVDSNGTDGFITSNQKTASGQRLTSIDLFDQTSNSVTQSIASGSTSSYSFTLPYGGDGPGIFGNDVGLLGVLDYSPLGVSYNLFDPVSGSLGAAWTPPAPLNSPLILSIPAANQVNDNVAFEAAFGSNLDIYGSQITQNTFSPVYNIAPLLQNFGSPPTIFGFAEDATTSTAVAAAAGSGQGLCDAPIIVSVNLSNGNTTSFAGVQQGVSSMAIDSSTGNAVIPTNLSCDTGGIGIYNLATGSGFQVVPPEPGSPIPTYTFYLHSAADPVNHLFLVANLFGPVANGNNNALSEIFVYTETGTLQEVISRVYLPPTSPLGNDLQVNPQTRTGYITGPGLEQLAVFHY
jgi:hypothetical protein